MTYGVVLEGEEGKDPLQLEEQWRNDVFGELYDNDRLFAYCIRGSEELKRSVAAFNV